MNAWRKVLLGSVVTFQRGYDLPHRDRRLGAFPVVTSAGITDFHSRPMVNPPGVVTGRYGTIGGLFFIDQPFWPLNTTLYVRDFHGNDPRFTYFLLQQFDFESFSGKSGVPGVNRNDLHKEPVWIPASVAEQKEVAHALGDVELLLNELNLLIEKKRQIKQAAMQELLTGKRRLPGFEGEWEVKRLGDVATIDPENLDSNTQPHYRFKYISLEDVDQGSLLNWSEQEFSSSPSRARRRLRRNDVLVSTVRPNLKSHLLFNQDRGEWVCSTGFAVLRCHDNHADPSYVYFHLFGYFINKQIEAMLTGSSYPAINSRDVRSLEIPVPTLSEQKAIGGFLASMDEELTSLAQRLKKASLLKQGMLQQLLTGKIRLI